MDAGHLVNLIDFIIRVRFRVKISSDFGDLHRSLTQTLTLTLTITLTLTPTLTLEGSVACHDFDLDGDLDCIFGCQDGTVTLRTNEGGSNLNLTLPLTLIGYSTIEKKGEKVHIHIVQS